MTGPVCHPEYEDWSDLPSSLVSDCLGRFSAMAGAIRSITGVGMVGPAYTLQTVVGDNLSIHFALANVPAGSVLVIDAGGVRGPSGVGGSPGGGGRAAGHPRCGHRRSHPGPGRADRPALPGVRPRHQSGRAAQGRRRSEQVTVSCGGSAGLPGRPHRRGRRRRRGGPAPRIREIHALASARSALEQEWMKKIMSGMPSPEVLGLDRSKR